MKWIVIPLFSLIVGIALVAIALSLAEPEPPTAAEPEPPTAKEEAEPESEPERSEELAATAVFVRIVMVSTDELPGRILRDIAPPEPEEEDLYMHVPFSFRDGRVFVSAPILAKLKAATSVPRYSLTSDAPVPDATKAGFFVERIDEFDGNARDETTVSYFVGTKKPVSVFLPNFAADEATIKGPDEVTDPHTIVLSGGAVELIGVDGDGVLKIGYADKEISLTPGDSAVLGEITRSIKIKEIRAAEIPLDVKPEDITEEMLELKEVEIGDVKFSTKIRIEYAGLVKSITILK